MKVYGRRNASLTIHITELLCLGPKRCKVYLMSRNSMWLIACSIPNEMFKLPYVLTIV